MTTNDTANDTTAANTAAESGTGMPPRGLAARAITAARRYRATDTAGYHNRHTDPRWARRAATAREVAVALAVPVDAVTVTDDPTRRYGIAGQYTGDLITVTDPDTGEAWRFIPDFQSGWLLLGPCPTCSEPVPHTRVASLVDLGAWCDPDNHASPPPPPEFAFDPAHQPTCPYTADNRAPQEH